MSNTILRYPELAPAVLAAALTACASGTVLLNSERIERRFGSYGIELLASENGLRRSSLYSTRDGARTCRTYAVVRFTETPDNSYRPEHVQVLAGNSLGKVFKTSGWEIHKQSLHIGNVEVASDHSEVLQLMKLPAKQTLALHVYHLLLARNTQVFEYATIVEAHHPDYLSESDLRRIYAGDNSEPLSAESLADILDLVRNAALD